MSRAPNIDESRQPGETPGALVARLAESKARQLTRDSDDLKNSLIIGSDQVAAAGDQLLGKPLTSARAIEQLEMLSGRVVVFHTGLCLLNVATSSAAVVVIPTPVRFRELTREEIERYVAVEQPLDCAGAFKSEGLGVALFEEIGGTDPSALIGLPLITLCRLLRSEGVNVLLGQPN